jgi:hypothetical protein
VSRSNDRRLHGMDARKHAMKRAQVRAYGKRRCGISIEDHDKASRAREKDAAVREAAHIREHYADGLELGRDGGVEARRAAQALLAEFGRKP